METVYKIKVKTNIDPRWLYPSERRYSASIVLGLGVVHFALSIMAFMLACLSLVSHQDNIELFLNPLNLTDNEAKTLNKNDAPNNIETIKKFNNNNSNNTNICIIFATTSMSIGSLAAAITAFLAWKRWYVDNNIKWFFVMSILSTTTSSICLLIIGTIIILTNYDVMNIISSEFLSTISNPGTKYVIAVNILIAAVLEWIWSILSIKISFTGMKNDYPEDNLGRYHGKIQVNTKRKGNTKGKIIPPDIINHFPVSGKIAKYLPKKPNGNLPKEESNFEYQERIDKFLSSNNDAKLSVPF